MREVSSDEMWAWKFVFFYQGNAQLALVCYIGYMVLQPFSGLVVRADGHHPTRSRETSLEFGLDVFHCVFNDRVDNGLL